MPLPKNAKLLYVGEDIVKAFPDLTSKVLQTFLESLPDWSGHLLFKPSIKQYLADHPDVARVLKSMKVL